MIFTLPAPPFSLVPEWHWVHASAFSPGAAVSLGSAPPTYAERAPPVNIIVAINLDAEFISLFLFDTEKWGSQSWLPPAFSRRCPGIRASPKKPPERRLQSRLTAPPAPLFRCHGNVYGDLSRL